MYQRIEKRWGTELILFDGSYLCKELTILPQRSTSMHMHYAKTETIYVVDGILQIDFDPLANRVIGPNGELLMNIGKLILFPRNSCTIREQTPHAMCSIKGAKYIEASGPFVNDSIRSYIRDDWFGEAHYF